MKADLLNLANRRDGWESNPLPREWESVVPSAFVANDPLNSATRKAVSGENAYKATVTKNDESFRHSRATGCSPTYDGQDSNLLETNVLPSAFAAALFVFISIFQARANARFRPAFPRITESQTCATDKDGRDITVQCVIPFAFRCAGSAIHNPTNAQR